MHEFSTRSQGDMRDPSNRETFLKTIGLAPMSLVVAQQVHGTDVAVVTKKDRGMEIPKVDGLVSTDLSVALGVLGADCVPILFIDPHAGVLGVTHAGWRGTLSGVVGEVVSAMKALGSKPKDIEVHVGPHIGRCCYDVSEKRATLFRKTFGGNPNVASLTGGTWHIDLGYANVLLLLKEGISRDQIIAPVTCTSCQLNSYFSYRKDSKETFGEIMGVVGYAK